MRADRPDRDIDRPHGLPFRHLCQKSGGPRHEGLSGDPTRKALRQPGNGRPQSFPETAPGGCHPSRSTDSATSATTASTSPTVSIGPGTTAKITSDSTIVMSGASPCIGEMMIALP